jgi:hypothetical protein
MEEAMKCNLSFLLILLFFIPSLACGSFSTTSVTGSGSIETQTFDVSNFDRVLLGGFGDVYVEQGPKEGLSVQTDANILPLLEIEVRGRELRLETKPGIDITPSETIVYNLTVKDLNGITLAGSGNFHVEPVKSGNMTVSLPGSGNIDFKGLNAGDLSVNLNGSGNITIQAIDAKTLDASLNGSGDMKLEGHTNSQNLIIRGSGNYLAGNLETDKTDVSMAGSAEVTLWVHDELTVSISGSGNIEYYGKPTLSQSVSGSGNIKGLGEK